MTQARKEDLDLPLAMDLDIDTVADAKDAKKPLTAGQTRPKRSKKQAASQLDEDYEQSASEEDVSDYDIDDEDELMEEAPKRKSSSQRRPSRPKVFRQLKAKNFSPADMKKPEQQEDFNQQLQKIVNVRKCSFIKTEHKPTSENLAKLALKTNFAFVRHNQDLYSIDRTNEKLIIKKYKMSSERLAKFDRIMRDVKANTDQPLKKAELHKICKVLKIKESFFKGSQLCGLSSIGLEFLLWSDRLKGWFYCIPNPGALARNLNQRILVGEKRGKHVITLPGFDLNKKLPMRYHTSSPFIFLVSPHLPKILTSKHAYLTDVLNFKLDTENMDRAAAGVLNCAKRFGAEFDKQVEQAFLAAKNQTKKGKYVYPSYCMQQFEDDEMLDEEIVSSSDEESDAEMSSSNSSSSSSSSSGSSSSSDSSSDEKSTNGSDVEMSDSDESDSDNDAKAQKKPKKAVKGRRDLSYVEKLNILRNLQEGSVMKSENAPEEAKLAELKLTTSFTLIRTNEQVFAVNQKSSGNKITKYNLKPEELEKFDSQFKPTSRPRKIGFSELQEFNNHLNLDLNQFKTRSALQLGVNSSFLDNLYWSDSINAWVYYLPNPKSFGNFTARILKGKRFEGCELLPVTKLKELYKLQFRMRNNYAFLCGDIDKLYGDDRCTEYLTKVLNFRGNPADLEAMRREAKGAQNFKNVFGEAKEKKLAELYQLALANKSKRKSNSSAQGKKRTKSKKVDEAKMEVDESASNSASSPSSSSSSSSASNSSSALVADKKADAATVNTKKRKRNDSVSDAKAEILPDASSASNSAASSLSLSSNVAAGSSPSARHGFFMRPRRAPTPIVLNQPLVASDAKLALPQVPANNAANAEPDHSEPPAKKIKTVLKVTLFKGTKEMTPFGRELQLEGFNTYIKDIIGFLLELKPRGNGELGRVYFSPVAANARLKMIRDFFNELKPAGSITQKFLKQLKFRVENNTTVVASYLSQEDVGKLVQCIHMQANELYARSNLKVFA